LLLRRATPPASVVLFSPVTCRAPPVPGVYQGIWKKIRKKWKKYNADF
jgi:hypothetical protein